MGKDKSPVRMKVSPHAPMPKTIVCQPQGTSQAGTSLNSAGEKKFHLARPSPEPSPSFLGDLSVFGDCRLPGVLDRVSLDGLAEHKHFLCGLATGALHAPDDLNHVPCRQDIEDRQHGTVKLYVRTTSQFAHTSSLTPQLKYIKRTPA